MVATIGAAVLTSMVAASSRMAPLLTPRPVRATATGRPAPTTEPKARTRISRAATMPISSPYPSIGAAALLGTSPPSSTWRPASRVGSTASSSGSRLLIRSGSVTGTSYWTSIRAVLPASEKRGSETVATWAMSARRSLRAVRSPWASWVPDSSWTTTWAELKPDSGRCSRSWSMPTWARASGTL